VRSRPADDLDVVTSVDMLPGDARHDLAYPACILEMRAENDDLHSR
jgi:hypothetical protein